MYFPTNQILHCFMFKHIEFFVENKPETNRRLTRDNLYPDPSNSNSIPDSVVPSQLNCVLIVAGVLGPFVISILALRDPTPLFSEC